MFTFKISLNKPLFNKPLTQNVLKEGDFVEVSTKNVNHLGYGVCAYAGWKGTVSKIWEDGSFAITREDGGAELVVPLGRKEKYYLIRDGKLICQRKVKGK